MLAFASLTMQATVPQNVLPPKDYGKVHQRSLSGSATNTTCGQKGFASGISKKVVAFTGENCPDVEKLGQLELVVSEDFSLLTTGTEAQPDLSVSLDIPALIKDPATGEYVANPAYQYPWNNMKPEYVHGDLRWGISNAYPAGGMVYFPLSKEEPEAHIVPPVLDLTANDGTYVLEFRAKLRTEPSENPLMPTTMEVAAAETHNWAPSWDDVDSPYTVTDLTTEWKTYRFIFQGAGPSTLNNILGTGTEGGIFIDDVKIYSLRPYLKTPVLKRHTDFTGSSFVLNWSAVDGAEKYLVNVWSVNETGETEYLMQDIEVSATSLKVENADPLKVYYFSATAVGGGHTSVTPIARVVYDIVAPTLAKAEQTDETGYNYRGGVEAVPSAFGYNYTVMAKRVAESDGSFTITNEDFTGWKHPNLGENEEYTKENPYEYVSGLYYPTDIKQQGWYGDNFMTYKDYISLASFFYTATNGREQACWVSPEFDLSRDNGKISIDLKLAATRWAEMNRFADCVIALFNYNDELGDYEQVESTYCIGLSFDWQNRHVELTKGSSRSMIGFFAVNSYEDLYIDDIVIRQNYKKGDLFMDPFYYRTWQLAETADDPTKFDFNVPDYASGKEVYNKAQAVRYSQEHGKVLSPISATEYVASTTDTNQNAGISLVENGLAPDVEASNGVITVQNATRAEVSVTDVSGRTITLGRAATVTYKPGVHGCYVVCVGNRSIKVVL